MKSVVALVEAGPDTIIEDYGRVLDLARLPRPGGEGLALVPQVRTGGWLPGAGSPPWQLDGVLTWLTKWTDPRSPTRGDRPAVVLPASPNAGPTAGADPGVEDLLTRHGATLASDHFRRLRPFRAEPALPDLEAALPRGLALPTGLRERTTLLLPVPALPADRPVSGAVNLLRALLAPGLGRSRRAHDLEILADLIRFARQALPDIGVVLDGIFWQVGGHPVAGPATGPAVARNILLAGSDPVAVDAVAARLAGRDPEKDPWYRRCRDRDLGAVRPEDIRLAGRADLLERDFGIPYEPAEGPTIPWRRWPGARLLRRPWRESTLKMRHAGTPWGRLYDDYRAGGPPKEER